MDKRYVFEKRTERFKERFRKIRVHMCFMSFSFMVCRAKPRLKMMWWVPVTQMVPPGLRIRHASPSHLTLNW